MRKSFTDDHFMTRWITVKEGEEKVVHLELIDPGSGRFTVASSLSPKYRFAWLLKIER